MEGRMSGKGTEGVGGEVESVNGDNVWLVETCSHSLRHSVLVFFPGLRYSLGSNGAYEDEPIQVWRRG